MSFDTSSVVLHLGKRRVAGRKYVDGEDVLACTRTVDALVFGWAIDLDQFDDPEEGAELLVEKFGDLLRLHRDERGILVGPAPALDRFKTLESATYAEIVAAMAPTGRWIPNVSHEPGATGAALERVDIPLPDLPRSRRVELTCSRRRARCASSA